MVILLVLILAPSIKVTDQYVYHPDAPTLVEYNHQKYQEYLGEKPEPIEITYIEQTYVEFTANEIDLMARVVMSEASILPFDGKQAIAQTIINRVRSDKFPNTVSGVVYQPNQYSTSDNGDVTTECYEAIQAAIDNRPFPDDLFYFRQDQYHSFGYPYMRIKNTYFSTGSEYE